jgi:two-component system, LytTR family, sensor kinase
MGWVNRVGRVARGEGAFGSTFGIALAVWTVFGLVFASSTYWAVRTHGHSTALIFFYVLLVWYGWAAATPLVAWLGRRLPLVPFSLRASIAHALAALVMSVLHCAWWTALAVWMRPFDDMQTSGFWEGLTEGYGNRVFFEVMIYFAVLGTTFAVDYQRRLRQREIATLELEKSLAHASLRALELQIQPHFLFNTLHAIGGLVRKGHSAEAIEMIAGLSDLLRHALEHAGQHLVPLERELDILGRYLHIQRIRFPDRLRVRIDSPQELGRASVPSMLLQPLAENAIRHGIEPSAAPGTIELRIRRDGDLLRIHLFNTGPALREPRSGIGLQNIRARLEQLYGGRHSFSLEDDPGGRGGVMASLAVPFEEMGR